MRRLNISAPFEGREEILLESFLGFWGDLLARLILATFVSQTTPSSETAVRAVDGVYATSTQEVQVVGGTCIIKIKKESLLWEATLAFQNEVEINKLLEVISRVENFQNVIERKYMLKNDHLKTCLRADFIPQSQAIEDAWELLNAPREVQKIRRGKIK